MKILHVVPYFSGAWAYGGIPRIVAGLARALAELGHHVCVLTTDSSGRECSRSLSGSGGSLRVHSLPNLSTRLAYRYQFFTPLGMGQFLQKELSQFQLVHIHGCHHLPGVLAFRYLRRFGIPYLLSPYGTAPRIEQRFLAKLFFDVLLWDRVFTHASRYHAISRYEEAQLQEMGVSRKNISVIYPGLNLDEFADLPPRGEFRRRYGIGEAEKIILYLGRISPRKGIDHLLQAFSRLKREDSRLVIAGNDSGYRSRAERISRRLGISKRVMFPGLLCGRDRLPVYVDADLLVYPSTQEAFGLVPCEAVLCNTPVVITRESGCAEVLNGIGGVTKVAYGDVEGLEKALLEGLEADHSDRGGRDVLKEKLGWERSGKAITDLYERVISTN